MALLTISFSRIWHGFGRSIPRPISSGDDSSPPDASPEATRTRRDFIHEMLSRNPDAFSSDLDVQYMMHLFPGKF